MERRDMLKGIGAAVATALTANALAAGKPGGEHDDHSHHHHDHSAHDHGATKQLQPLIQAASDCAQKGDQCLAHCLTLLGEGDKAMAACARSVNETIALCRALETLAGQGSKYTAHLAKVALDACKECEKECRKHEKKHAECKACADACAACIKACQNLV